MLVFDGMQDFLSEMAGSSCYALQLVRVAQDTRKMNCGVLEAILIGMENEYIYFNWKNFKDPRNFFVYNPELFLKKLTGFTFVVSYCEDKNYIPKENEWRIDCYSYINDKGAKLTHFFSREVDTKFQAYCRKWGQWDSARIIRLVA